jgi:hypothetical protein
MSCKWCVDLRNQAWLCLSLREKLIEGYLCPMRLTLRLCLLAVLPLPALAQKAWVAEDGVKHPIDTKEAVMHEARPTIAPDTSAIKAFLMANIPYLSAEGSGLMLEHSVKSPKALHFQFAQLFSGRKVFRGTVKVNMRPDGRVLSIIDHTWEVPDGTRTEFPPHDAYHDGLAVHYDHRDNGRLDRYTLEETFFPEDGEMLPCIRLEVLEHTDRYYEMVLNSDVRVIYQNDLITYSTEPKDSVVTLWVFNPDPLTSAGQLYGVPYADQDDTDIPELNAERIPVESVVTYEDGLFRLRNSAVTITDFSAPATAATTSVEDGFNFTRSQPGFEECNALYHITRFRDHIRSLGFDELMNYPIQVDAHALNGADNSQFNSGMSPPSLAFGNGGVDDAEDADVIIHEYGHAIMHSAAPGSNVGTQRRAMDEAIGDYFASSYSRSINPFRWGDVFTWDGHNEFWDGRSTVSTKHYPEDVVNNIYRDAPIWSATLMQIWEDIGREATDAIMMQAAYSFAQGLTMPQAAVLFLQADTLLFDGAHFTPIHTWMYERGLLPFELNVSGPGERTGRYRLLGSAGFADGSGPVTVSGPQPFTVELMDMTGRVILRENSRSGRHAIVPEGLTAGVYLLSVRGAEGLAGFRVVRR